MPISNFQPVRFLDPDFLDKFTYLMANSADSDQLASSEANRSGSTLFAKAGYIQVQQDKVKSVHPAFTDMFFASPVAIAFC